MVARLAPPLIVLSAVFVCQLAESVNVYLIAFSAVQTPPVRRVQFETVVVDWLARDLGSLVMRVHAFLALVTAPPAVDNTVFHLTFFTAITAVLVVVFALVAPLLLCIPVEAMHF